MVPSLAFSSSGACKREPEDLGQSATPNRFIVMAVGFSWSDLLDEIDRELELKRNKRWPVRRVAFPLFEITSNPEIPLTQILERRFDLLEGREVLQQVEQDIQILEEKLPYIFPHYINMRVGRKIPVRIISDRPKDSDSLLKTRKKKLREFVFPKEKQDFKSLIFIYGKKVAVLSIQREPYYGVIIESKDFSDSHRKLFDLVWNSCS